MTDLDHQQRLEKINQQLVRDFNIMASALRHIRRQVGSYQQYPPCREACFAAEVALKAVGERLESEPFIQEADYRRRWVYAPWLRWPERTWFQP